MYHCLNKRDGYRNETSTYDEEIFEEKLPKRKQNTSQKPKTDTNEGRLQVIGKNEVK